MKIKQLSTVALACSVAYGAMAQTILSDNFNGSAINSSLWQTSTPFSDSSITESGGFAVFQNRGRIITANALPTAIDITGTFEFTGSSHDNLRIVTRADGITSNPSAEYDHGIGFGLEMQNDSGQTANNIWIQELGYPGSSPELARGTYALSLNTAYNFRITDNGNNLALYIDDLTTPVLTATDSAIYGNLVALYNREGAGAGSSISAGSIVQLDTLTIQSAPEPSIVSLTLAGGFGILYLRRQKFMKRV
jgi:hypothetical protein